MLSLTPAICVRDLWSPSLYYGKSNLLAKTRRGVVAKKAKGLEKEVSSPGAPPSV